MPRVLQLVVVGFLVVPAVSAQPAGQGDFLSPAALHQAGLVKFWQFQLPLDAGQTITDCHLVDDQIYAGTNDGWVYALHADTGTLRWIRQVTRGGYRFWRPCHAGDRVIFVNPADVRQYDRYFGSPIRMNDLRFPAGAPAVTDGRRLYIGGIDRRFYAFQLDWPYEVWKAGTGGQITSRAAFFGEGNIAFASEDGGVYACRARDKARQWVSYTTGPIKADLVATNEGVFAASTDQSLYLLEPQTGAKRWRVRLSSPLLEPPAVVGTAAYQYSADDGLVAINVAGLTEEERIRWKLPEGRALLTVDGAQGYVMSRNEELLVVTLDDGVVRERAAATGMTMFMPRLEEPAIFLASPTGKVFCARREGVPFVRVDDVRAALLAGRQSAAQSQPAAITAPESGEGPGSLGTRQPGPPVGGKSKISKEYSGDGG